MATSATIAPRTRRCTVALEGCVQGLGFRPAVYRFAVQHQLSGSVRNTRQGLLVDVEGDETAIARFLDDLAGFVPIGGNLPRRSVTWGQPWGVVRPFSIDASLRDGGTQLVPVPDLAICDRCLADLRDPNDRRHGHAFVTCTTCGPRFTIVRTLPYDRDGTTMTDFPVCAACRREYETPNDRRFHAETISCPRCGPALTVRGPDGQLTSGADPIRVAARVLARGGIVAVKGLGGYHLACDATRPTAVAELRERKHRESKPLAVMVKDVAAARVLCHASEEEAQLLTSTARPIVLLAKRAATTIANNVAPCSRELGVMLSYTPLHHLLLDAVDVPLVMTSGNATDDTIAYIDADAVDRLSGVADLFLLHDRPIHVQCDDSVARVVRGEARLIRRSRGYVPLATRLPVETVRPILACGGELKNTFAVVRGRDVFLSQHLGDLSNERAYRSFVDSIEHFKGLLGVSPEVVAHDLHPAYRSTVYAKTLDGVERVGVQHHHAHIASCLADNGIDRRVIGVAWDGTGYGVDGHVWGGEFLIADLTDFVRAGRFELVPMPGGDAAVREPWRMAAAFLKMAYGETTAKLDLAFLRRLDPAAWRTLSRAIDRGLNAPMTSSAGRLFDAVASLLRLRDSVEFEGQAAMELEALAEPHADRIYPTGLTEMDGTVIVRTQDIICAVVDDLLRETAQATISARFHATLVDVLVQVCRRIRQRTGIDAVALSGGVFQNVWLLEAALDALERAGFEVYSHRQVPANDGGLALGQAAVAARRMSGKDGR
jgi:hydrogenase maturation protein HypF